jgi:hydrogenase/urease accessory protein HupE|tara:strand:- start:432 stop:1553 length:1122 start_codon:yes stop_codon:yes gene_type:complete
MFIRYLIIFVSLCQFAFSHELKPAIANLELTSNNSIANFQLRIQLNLESIIAGIEPEHDNTNQSKNSEKYEELRRLSPEYLLKEYNKINESLLNNIYFFNGNEKIQFKESFIKIDNVGDISLARESEILLKGTFSTNNPLLKFYWNSSYGSIVLRVNKDKEELFTKYLKTGDTATFSTSKLEKQKITSVIKNYITVGFQHIVPKGLDHILFVVGLFLLSVRFKPLVWQISAFTLAHTLTIFLGALHIVNVPPTIVEPIIAISISYIAIENIFLKDLTRWRPLIVFVFGLLHGLGFAGILNEIGMSDNYFITSLISFNLGVEIGQLVVISICFLSIGLWFGKKDWYRTYLTTPLSAIIAVIGLVWFVKRIGFLF